MRKEVDNCIKMIGQYNKCLKTSDCVVVEELVAFLLHFQDLTDIVSTKVTSLFILINSFIEKSKTQVLPAAQIVKMSWR